MDSSNTKSGKLQKLTEGQKIFKFRRGGRGFPMRGRSENFHFEGGGALLWGGNLLGGG